MSLGEVRYLDQRLARSPFMLKRPSVTMSRCCALIGRHEQLFQAAPIAVRIQLVLQGRTDIVMKRLARTRAVNGTRLFLKDANMSSSGEQRGQICEYQWLPQHIFGVINIQLNQFLRRRKFHISYAAEFLGLIFRRSPPHEIDRHEILSCSIWPSLARPFQNGETATCAVQSRFNPLTSRAHSSQPLGRQLIGCIGIHLL